MIERLQNQHSVVILVTNSLTNYMNSVRQLVKKYDLDDTKLVPDGRYSHIIQVQERLNFLRFLLKVGFTYLFIYSSIDQFISLLRPDDRRMDNCGSAPSKRNKFGSASPNTRSLNRIARLASSGFQSSWAKNPISILQLSKTFSKTIYYSLILRYSRKVVSSVMKDFSKLSTLRKKSSS